MPWASSMSISTRQSLPSAPLREKVNWRFPSASRVLKLEKSLYGGTSLCNEKSTGGKFFYCTVSSTRSTPILAKNRSWSSSSMLWVLRIWSKQVDPSSSLVFDDLRNRLSSPAFSLGGNAL